MQMTLPGFLNDVGPDQAAKWNKMVSDLIEKSILTAQDRYSTLGFDVPIKMVLDADALGSRLGASWSGFPIRYEKTLGRGRSEKFLSHRSDSGVQGRFGHEEFLEWRDVHDENGKLLRVEMTTETQEYWCFLASVDPSQTLQLLADFAHVQTIDPHDVYGTHDPFSNDSTSAQRFAAFRTQMTRSAYDQPVQSSYNNGVNAIAFMGNATNSLTNAINALACGAYPLGTSDHSRPLTVDELTSTLPFQIETADRNSDQMLVSAAIRAAWEGREISLPDPVGLYIREIGQGATLLMPDAKTPIPANWIKATRGRNEQMNGKTVPFFQRLVIEPDDGVALGDLIIATTGRRVRSGADIARLVTVALHIKTSTQHGTSAHRRIGLVPAITDKVKHGEQIHSDVQQVYETWLAHQDK